MNILVSKNKPRNEKQISSVGMLLKKKILWPKFSDIMNMGESISQTPFNPIIYHSEIRRY